MNIKTASIKTFVVIVIIAAGGGGYYYYQNHYNQPCQKPIPYSLNRFDTQFGISQADFLKLVDQATHIWENAIHKDLFVYTDKGGLKINLIYDSRQAATVKLQGLGISINGDKDTYAVVKAKYDSLFSQYNSQKTSLDQQVTTYQSDKNSYETQVKYWNDQGGAPKSQYDQLNQLRIKVNTEADAINAAQATLNSVADTINATVNVLNQIAHNLNLNVKNYNTIGAQQGTEFQEGLYKRDASGQEIDIYQFDNRDKLVRVLAHELGHALGLDHLNNPNAIMYALNEGANANLTADDVAALKAVCHLTPPLK